MLADDPAAIPSPMRKSTKTRNSLVMKNGRVSLSWIRRGGAAHHAPALRSGERVDPASIVASLGLFAVLGFRVLRAPKPAIGLTGPLIGGERWGCCGSSWCC